MQWGQQYQHYFKHIFIKKNKSQVCNQKYTHMRQHLHMYTYISIYICKMMSLIACHMSVPTGG